MVAHLVMFRPRADLTSTQRQTLVTALRAALRDIPTIRRARVGQRVTHGSGYELLMRTDYPYIAVLEFDDLAGLQAYLAHPTHAELGTRFFESFEEALMYDYDVEEADAGIAKLL
jgi:hypothetical protein